MLFISVIFLSAISISTVGAYFSIVGLATIFPGSELSVIIMGIALEIGKLVTVLWLHENWRRAGFFIKIYFMIAVFTLMFITSIGIFGYLSKSHIEHQNSVRSETTQIEVLEIKIQKEKDIIKNLEGRINKDELNQYSQSEIVNQEIKRLNEKIKSINERLLIMIKVDQDQIDKLNEGLENMDQKIENIKNNNKGLFSNSQKKIKEELEQQKEKRFFIENKIQEHRENISNQQKGYQEEYNKINKDIDALSAELKFNKQPVDKNYESINSKIKESLNLIQSMEIEKSKLSNIVNNIEVEIGPIKYIVGLLEDFGVANIDSGQAVRLVIILIMIVFDPLAITLVLAAHLSFKRRKMSAYESLRERALGN